MATKDETTDEKDESYSEDSSKGVDIPEEFQIKCKELLADCKNKACLSYIRDAVYAKEDEIRQAKMKKESKGGKKTPSDYNMSDAPSSL